MGRSVGPVARRGDRAGVCAWLRPILMTTAAMVPGPVIASGLSVGTLFVLPAIYMLPATDCAAQVSVETARP